jgi:hypothetical protein
MAVGLVAAVPAKADPIRIAQAAFPPYEIMTIVRSTGLDPLSRPVLRGSAYFLRALDGYDREVRVVVDAQRGQILSVQPVVPVSAPYGAIPPRYAVPRYAPGRYYPPGYEYEPQMGYEGPPPRPPARVPSAANAPGGKADAKATPSAKTSPTPKSAVVGANPLAIPAPAIEPKSASNSGTETPPASAPDAGNAGSPASAIPPVQTLE